MTGAILAGGENSRIPLVKGCIEINGSRIIDTNVALFGRFFQEVVISTNTPELYFYCGVRMIGDVVGQRGPLTGIFSVLLNTEDDIFVVACDMPFIRPELIGYMVDRYKSQKSKDRKSEVRSQIVIPVFERSPQPLCGIYSKGILPIVEERLRKDSRGLKDMLEDLNVLYIDEDEVRKIDPEGRSFVNINTMEDLEKIKGGKTCLV